MKRKSCWIEDSFGDGKHAATEEVQFLTSITENSVNRSKRANKHHGVGSSSQNFGVSPSHALWCDSLKLQTTSKLCVHVKKIKEFTEALSRYKNEASVILLKGPSGCGKSSLITSACLDLNLTLKRFELSAGCNIYSDEVSQDSELTEFQQFLFSDPTQVFATFSLEPRVLNVQPCVLWLPEMPNVFVDAFYKLENLLSEYLSSGAFQSPIIIEFSDYNQSKIRGFSQSFHFQSNFKVINMNPIAPTFMKKGLLLLKNVVPKSVKCHFSDALLKQVCEISNGDMRLAINNLQLVCGGDRSCTKSLICSRKDFGIGLFHSIGKLLYPKRDNPSIKSSTCKKCKMGSLVTSVDQIVDFCSISAQFLLGTLEENMSKVLHDLETYSLCLDDFLVSDQINALKYGNKFESSTLENVSSFTCASCIVFWASFHKLTASNGLDRSNSHEFAPITAGLRFTNSNGSINSDCTLQSATKKRDMEIMDALASNSFCDRTFQRKPSELTDRYYCPDPSIQLFTNDVIIDDS